MKTRTGFVSNSSTSSLVIEKAKVNEVQLALIKRHSELGEIICEDIGGLSDFDCPWKIEITDNTIEGWTDMDNFDMRWFMSSIGIDVENMHWGD